jgi:hypothetical protein
LAGERPPVPVPQNTADDPDLIASATQVYQDFLAGSLSRSDLPDFRAVHRDDLLTSLGFRAQPDRTPEELLRNACGQCHNPSLSQATSKSRFDVTQLDTMPAAAFQTALDRIRRAPTDPLRMPPLRYRSLTIPQVDKLDAYLRERLEGGN